MQSFRNILIFCYLHSMTLNLNMETECSSDMPVKLYQTTECQEKHDTKYLQFITASLKYIYIHATLPLGGKKKVKQSNIWETSLSTSCR
jgi:hypothetical protein